MAPVRRPDVAPQGYMGLDAIATRMGVSKSTILAWHRRYVFPIYLRRIGLRRVWYTHEGLIERWEVARCLDDHHRRYGTGAPRRGRPGSGVAPPPRGPTGEVLEALNALSQLVSRLAHVPDPAPTTNGARPTSAAALRVP